jgi:hypothetical protein
MQAQQGVEAPAERGRSMSTGNASARVASAPVRGSGGSKRQVPARAQSAAGSHGSMDGYSTKKNTFGCLDRDQRCEFLVRACSARWATSVRFVSRNDSMIVDLYNDV